MNWLQKISYANYNLIQMVTEKIQGVIENREDGSEGGAVAQLMQQIGPDPSVCTVIMNACAADASAPSKMKILSDAAGCEWKPEMVNPPMPKQPDMSMMPMPSLGQQEKPMDIPSAEVV